MAEAYNYLDESKWTQRPDIGPSTKDFLAWLERTCEAAAKLDYVHTEDNVLITPEIARAILDNPAYVNRGKKNEGINAHVNRLAGMILAGRWNHYSGDTVKFNRDGVCIDAGNRLNAIIRTNKPLRMTLAFNCVQTPDMDTGKSRSFRENVEIITDNEYNARWWSAINMLWRLSRTKNESFKCPHETLYDYDLRVFYDYLRDKTNMLDMMLDTIHTENSMVKYKLNDMDRAAFLLLSLISDGTDEDALRDAISLFLCGPAAFQTTFPRDEKAWTKMAQLHNWSIGAPQKNCGPVTDWANKCSAMNNMRVSSTHEQRNACISLIATWLDRAIRKPNSNYIGVYKSFLEVQPALEKLFSKTEADLDKKYQHILDGYVIDPD